MTVHAFASPRGPVGTELQPTKKDPSMQEITEVAREDYRPWGEQIPDAIGDLCRATTDQGTEVLVWRPYEEVEGRLRFWCHGHATLSYHLLGYSIFSGDELAKVLDDEWTQVGKKPTVGDIVVFRATNESEHDTGTILHSARVEWANHHFGRRTEFLVSSKNGPQRLKRRTDIASVQSSYRDTFWYLEQTSCGCSTTRVRKQYYRRSNGLHRTAFEGSAWDLGLGDEA